MVDVFTALICCAGVSSTSSYSSSSSISRRDPPTHRSVWSPPAKRIVILWPSAPAKGYRRGMAPKPNTSQDRPAGKSAHLEFPPLKNGLDYLEQVFGVVKRADEGVVRDADGRGVRRPCRGTRQGLWSAE